MSIYEYSYESPKGDVIPMSQYKGQVMLIVNTASKCGFTPQYEGLQKLYTDFSDQKFSIIGFPCGQFNDQEFNQEQEITEFCTLNYGVTFPLSKKVEVRGEHAIPLFKYLTSQKGFEGFGKGAKAVMLSTLLKAKYGKGFHDEQIKWNFTKFLVDKEGNVIKRYEPTVEPDAIRKDLESLL